MDLIRNHAGFNKILVGSSSSPIVGSDYYNGGYSTLILSDSDSVNFIKNTSVGVPFIKSNVQVDDSTIEISASNGLQVKGNGIGNAQIANSSITINAGSGVLISGSAVSLGGSCTIDVNADNATLATSGDTILVKDNGITGVKIANGAVTNTKLGDSSVGTGKIQTDAVTTAKIADDNVTTAKIAGSAITTDKISNASVTTAKIASNNVVKSISVSNGVEFTTGDGQDSVSIGGINAAADNTTKGVAAFNQTDFNDTNGVISLSAASGVGPSWYLTTTGTKRGYVVRG